MKRLAAHWRSDLPAGIVPVVLIFGAVYIFALTFLYIEGDDASSVVYHAMGRNRALQPPYGAYHGMMDVLLSVLPASEPFVRYAAIGLNAAAAVLMVCLILMLVEEWLPASGPAESVLRGVMLPACTPEVFYLGLVYTPSVAAMSLAVAAHIIIRRAWRSRLSGGGSVHFGLAFAFSVFLFGAGVACRWDIGMYLVLIVADILFEFGGRENRMRTLGLAVLWAAAACVASLLAIFASGYGIKELMVSQSLATNEVVTSYSWFAIAGSYQAMFTPAFVVLFVVGWVWLAVKHKRLAFLCLLAVIIVAPFLNSRKPKVMLPALPALWLGISAGIDLLFYRLAGGKFSNAARAAVILLTAVPWLAGLQVRSAETSWGPGFELKNASSTPEREWKLAFRGGLAVPMPEGPRPVGGHAFVLLNGEWRRLAAELDAERTAAIETAISGGHPVLQDEGNSFLVAKLLEMGFSTDDPKRGRSPNWLIERRFTNAAGDPVSLLVLTDRRALSDPVRLAELRRSNPTGKVVLYSGYSSTIRKLSETAPEAVSVLGPFSAVIDLERLIEKTSE